MESIVITHAIRTPVGSYLGSLCKISAEKLMSLLLFDIKKALMDYNVEIQEVIIGNVLSPSPNIARVSSLYAGMNYSIPAYTVNQLCGSSLRAVISAIHSIENCEVDVVIAGGVENMSQAPYYLPFDIRYNPKPKGEFSIIDSFSYASSQAQPSELFSNINMGITAENIAKKYSISREQQDEYAFQSQIKYQKAQKKEKFEEEIIPVCLKSEFGINTFSEDEHPRLDITLEKLRRLKPSFLKNGTVTAGNSCGMNDGASLAVIMNEQFANKAGISPLARIISYSSVGYDPRYMGISVVPAIKSALKRANLSVEDIDLFEINEAFAAQIIGCLLELGIYNNSEILSRINVNGGAIALGHALANSGTRILTTLLHELVRRNGRFGVAAMCVGGGQGIAIVVENVQDNK